MKFKTQFTKSVRVLSNPGSPYLFEYYGVLDKNGHTEVIKKKTPKNIHALIQLDKDSCDINLIVKSMTQSELDALGNIRGFYADTRDFPEDYPTLINRLNELKSYFEKLSPSIKSKFDNDPNVFMAQFGEDSWFNALGIDLSSEISSEVVKSAIVDDPIDAPIDTNGASLKGGE